MITIAKAVEDIISKTPFLEEGLSNGLINTSALARFIRPEIKKRLYKKDVSEAALVMALKRYQPQVRNKSNPAKFLANPENITVRSGIVEITLQNSPEVDRIRKEIAKKILDEREAFFNLIQGVKESTFIISKSLEATIKKYLPGYAVNRLGNLSSISIALPPGNRETPGVYYSLLKILAWNNINLVEVVSNSNELSLIFDNKDIDRAFSLIVPK
jgi:aspartokinase